MKDDILKLSRQNQINTLSYYFNTLLDYQISSGYFKTPLEIEEMKDYIVLDLQEYKKQANVSDVVIGISGGIDSALTASLFKEAEWNVHAFILPIDQNQQETNRGIEVCEFLDIDYKVLDLSREARDVTARLVHFNPTTRKEKVRAGNIRARLRMISLYDAANNVGGLVASTDNFSELSAGFWTLHGDVGDLSPIQSLYKSWEVPKMGQIMRLPQSVIDAKPTDGLGIDDGDEAQFGCSYLEWDIMLINLLTNSNGFDNMDDHAVKVRKLVLDRARATAFKRYNPVFLKNKLDPERFSRLERFDANYTPDIIK